MNDPPAKRNSPLPNASGTMTRLAYTRSKEAGVDVELLLKKAGLTLHQIEDPGVRLEVRDQISFLNLAADALHDDLLGFHLAQSTDLRELGLLYYVSASSEVLSMALQRAARYSSISNEGVFIKYVDGKDVVITFHYDGVSRHKDRHQIECFMTILIRLCQQLTGHRVVPIRRQPLPIGEMMPILTFLSFLAAMLILANSSMKSYSRQSLSKCRSLARIPTSTSS